MRAAIDKNDREFGIELSGDAALAWLAGHGFRAEPPSRRLRVVADRLRLGGMIIGRMYTNCRRIDRDIRSRGLFLSIVVDGEISVESAPGGFSLRKGTGFLHNSGTELLMSSTSPFGMVYLHLGEDFARRIGVALSEEMVIIQPDLGALRILLAVIVTTLNVEANVTDASWGFVMETIENAAAAVVSEAVVGRPGPLSRSGRLRSRAVLAIRQHHRDSNFGVASLASVLSASPSALHAAFAEVGTTPLNEIRRIRVEAVDHLTARHDGRVLELEDMVSLAGFRSARAYRSARNAVRGDHRDSP